VEWTVAIGVDTHREAHVAVAVDRLGRRLGALEFRVDESGFEELRRFASAHGRPAFAVEGTGSYGASLARALLGDGFAVFECERPRRRRRTDKNDLIDAELAARRLLAGEPRCRAAGASASSCVCCWSSGAAPSRRASRRSISSRQRS
jgi:transposase